MSTAPLPIENDALVALAESAEARIAAVKKITSLAIRVTNARDWVDENGTPYLQASGSEKIARLFGISWMIDEPQIEQHDDGHFSYHVRGEFMMGTATITAIGSRSSNDPFFGRAQGRDKHLSEIPASNVKKAAYTNCIGNGITRLLGLRNLTWEDVKASGHISQSGHQTVTFAGAHRLPNYGDYKGQEIGSAIPSEVLRFYAQGLERQIGNPSKAQYKAKNVRTLEAIQDELAGREVAGGHAASTAFLAAVSALDAEHVGEALKAFDVTTVDQLAASQQELYLDK